MAQISYTTINHVARKELGISMHEYAVADLVYNLSNNPESKHPGWCYASKDTMAEMLDLTRRTVINLINELEGKNILERSQDKKMLKTTSNWYETIVITVKKVHTTCEKSSQQPCEKISHNKDNNNKDIDNNIYTSILDHWNSKGIIKHRTMTDKAKRSINGRKRDGFTEAEILQSIDNYAEILHGKQYFWNYKWTLQDFLQRGFEKFLDGDIARQNYRKGGSPNGYENANRAKEGKYDDIQYEN